MPYGTVNTLVVDEDVMIVTMSDMNLEQISAMFQRLQLQPAVKAATLTLAATQRQSRRQGGFLHHRHPPERRRKGGRPMKHVFTNREKILLVILAIMLIAVGYWKLILTPINDDIADLQSRTASSRTAMIQSAAQLSQLNRMKSELETVLADPDAKPLPDYDNSERLLVELNTILSGRRLYTEFRQHRPAGGWQRHYVPPHHPHLRGQQLHLGTSRAGCPA